MRPLKPQGVKQPCRLVLHSVAYFRASGCKPFLQDTGARGDPTESLGSGGRGASNRAAVSGACLPCQALQKSLLRLDFEDGCFASVEGGLMQSRDKHHTATHDACS